MRAQNLIIPSSLGFPIEKSEKELFNNLLFSIFNFIKEKWSVVMNYFSIMNARSEFDFPISQAHFRFPIENTEKKYFML